MATERGDKKTVAVAVTTAKGTHLVSHLDATPIHVEAMVKLVKMMSVPLILTLISARQSLIRRMKH